MWIAEFIMICCMCYTLSWLLTVTSEIVKPAVVEPSPEAVLISLRDYPRQQTDVDTLVARRGEISARM